MKYPGIFLALLFTQTLTAAHADVSPAHRAELTLEAEAKARVKQLASALKTKLKAAMAEGGPVAAVEVCRESAPQIARRLSVDGWQVARTSLQVRNPQNAPDAWEEEVMQTFRTRLQQGDASRPLSQSKVQGGQFRYMQAILLAPQCLACHGSQIPPAIQDVLDTHYPDDRATGFSVGELRGAFTLTKSMR